MDKYISEAAGSLADSIHVRNNMYPGMYRGVVVNNDDKEFNRGRCKVYIPGIYPERFKEDDGALLPWAEPCQPLFCGGGGDMHNNGTFQCPDKDSTVWLFFENNDIQRPVMFGQTTDCEGKFDTDICKMYWEGMYVEFDKSTHTITASATNITAIAEKELNGYCETATLTSSVANVTATSAYTLTSPAITFNGDLTVNGNVHVTGTTTIDSDVTMNATETVANDSTIGGKSFLAHMHTGNAGAPTSPPL